MGTRSVLASACEFADKKYIVVSCESAPRSTLAERVFPLESNLFVSDACSAATWLREPRLLAPVRVTSNRSLAPRREALRQIALQRARGLGGQSIGEAS